VTFVLPAVIYEGERNSTLTSLAGSLRRPGLERSAIERELLRVNAQRCVPPLSDREVLTIAQSVAKYPPAGPNVTWGAPPRNLLEVARRRGYRLIGSVARIRNSLFTVGGRRGGGPFDVNLGGPSGPTCGCTWFSNRRNETRTCAHIEASRAWVRSRYGRLEVGPGNAV
jgi:hypothetical protein